MDTLRGALHADAAALRKRLVDIDMLMKRISDVTVARTLREDELANNPKTKFIGVLVLTMNVWSALGSTEMNIKL